MFDPVVDAVIGQALLMADLGAGAVRLKTALHVLSEEQATADEWVKVPYRDAAELGAGSKNRTYNALRWLVAHKVLFKHPTRRDGRGGPGFYKLNPVTETWQVKWTRDAGTRRLALRAAQATGRAALDQCFAAPTRGNSPWDAAPPTPGTRGKSYLSKLELPRPPGDEGAAKEAPNSPPAPRQDQAAPNAGPEETDDEIAARAAQRASRAFDVSLPGGAEVWAAMKRQCGPNAWLKGDYARRLEWLLVRHGPELVVIAIGIHPRPRATVGPPIIVEDLPALIEEAAKPCADLTWEPPPPVEWVEIAPGEWVRAEDLPCEDGSEEVAQ